MSAPMEVLRCSLFNDGLDEGLWATFCRCNSCLSSGPRRTSQPCGHVCGPQSRADTCAAPAHACGSRRLMAAWQHAVCLTFTYAHTHMRRIMLPRTCVPRSPQMNQPPCMRRQCLETETGFVGLPRGLLARLTPCSRLLGLHARPCTHNHNRPFATALGGVLP